ncbi:hypothetical protein TRICI_002809 [Trichomonascus ciferrii]|uniref:Uncharacterized protein n=1 Tax=Trichomonascus ciferrii TaxID=44093 RepID=A0A642V5I6_9ASCO|nr:hypothetical protein TRICI_002809 [Trichomonascus ciferrii]
MLVRQVRPQSKLRAAFGGFSRIRRNYSESDSPNAKKLKNRAPSHNYIILGAKSAKLLPRKERPKPTKVTVDPIKVDVLEEQRKQLLVFKSEADTQVVLDSIDMMKPLSDAVSESRYKQIRSDLKQSYSLVQLREYVSHHSKGRGLRGTTKDKLCDIILKDIWVLHVSKDVNETSDVIIEKTIQLSKRDLFIILSRNGAIPRSWTKSGARIVILAQESKIVIRSTSETFDWILASLHKTLQSITTVRIVLEGIRKIANVDNIPLSRIQQLSNVSLEMNAAKDTIYASALSRSYIDHARRLIVQSTGFKPRIKDEFVYDTANLSNTASYRIVDDDAMNWNERSKPWSRLQTLRKRVSDNPEAEKQLKLQVIPSNRELGVVEPGNLAKTIAQELVSHMATDKNAELPLTFTATFGYILHETQPQKKVESLASQMASNHSFTTNIPSVTQKCSGLPLNTLDIAHEEEPETSTPDQNADDLWKKLLEQEQSQEEPTHGIGSEIKPQKSKLVDTEDDYAYLAQLKFVPAPMGMGKSNQGNADFDTLPPLEMWLELDENDRCDLDSARVVAVEEEINTHLSLPSKPADIKFTTTRANFLDHNEPSVQAFLKRSNLDFSGGSPVNVPDFLTVTIGGKPTNYLYQAMLYRRQVDLKYNDSILQLSTIEGGGFEGRRVEATMVLDYTEGMNDFSQSDLENMISNSLTFNDSLKA